LVKGRIADCALAWSRLQIDSSNLIDPQLTHGCLELDPQKLAPQTTSRSVQLSLHNRPTPVSPTNRHTDHATCDICSRGRICYTCDEI